MDRSAYLSRIGVDDLEVAADERTLRLLQRRHLLSVPFENLDIHWKRPIVLDIDRFYKKIVINRRGGFCYELNGLFSGLLKDIGFTARLVSARVGNEHGAFSPEYDHAAIIVTIGEEEFLTDVGFGEFAAKPLRLVPDIEQTDETGVFVLRHRPDGYFEVLKRKADVWRSEYAFKPDERELSEFEARCDFQQYSPDSHFLKGRICSILTGNGRKTLNDDKFIVTANGGRTEDPVSSEDEFDAILLREFKIKRDANT
jgi:N-hydroxyarylamine O-acetyltransferase